MRKYTLVLRTVAPDMTSYGGFVWPKEGPVECPDWDPTPECGHGLHGLAWGMGNADLIDASEGRVWLLVKVATADLVDLDGKVKFPRGTVVYCGDRVGATGHLVQRAPAGTVCHFAMATAGNYGTATAGNNGTATAGRYGTATAGSYGTATAGDGGTATAGRYGTATAGDPGTLVLRHWDGHRYRLVVGYVGENGIRPNTPYRLNAEGKFEEAK